MTIVETTSARFARRQEARWYSFFSNRGDRLLNGRDLASRAYSVSLRLPVEIVDELRSMDDPKGFIEKAIVEALTGQQLVGPAWKLVNGNTEHS